MHNKANPGLGGALREAWVYLVRHSADTHVNAASAAAIAPRRLPTAENAVELVPTGDM